MGITLLLNSVIAMSIGSITSEGISIMTGAPIAICSALAPIILSEKHGKLYL